MATGAGKSLCYQVMHARANSPALHRGHVLHARTCQALSVPHLARDIRRRSNKVTRSVCRLQVPALLGERSLVIVISPLLSLMHDQISALRARNIPAATTAESSFERMVSCEGDARLLYTTPETALGRLRSKLGDLHRRVGIRLIAIDEAHCVSEWGHDFRPEYQRLAELRDELPGVPVMALTATATPRVQEEIVRNLGLGAGRGRHMSVVSTFDRPNLFYNCVDRSSDEAEQVLRDLVVQSSSDDAQPSIVYVLTQKEAEKIADKLTMMGAHQQRVSFYHAGLSDTRRTEVINEAHVPVAAGRRLTSSMLSLSLSPRTLSHASSVRGPIEFTLSTRAIALCRSRVI